MSISEDKKIIKQESMEDFEFLDNEKDLDIDLSKSPARGAGDKFHSGVSLVVSALCTLVEEEKLDVKISMESVITTAVGAVTGSLLGGPAGLTVGLLTGAIMAYRASPKSSKSPNSGCSKSTIRQIFSKMTMEEKKDLVKELVLSLKQSSVRSLILEILKNEKIRSVVLKVLSEFLFRKMGISLLKTNS